MVIQPENRAAPVLDLGSGRLARVPSNIVKSMGWEVSVDGISA